MAYNTKLDLRTRTKVLSALYTSGKPLTSIEVKRLVEVPDSGKPTPKDAPNYDWHEYLYFLEGLTFKGYAKQVGTNGDGQTRYAGLNIFQQEVSR